MTGPDAWPAPGMTSGLAPVLGSQLAFVAAGSGPTVLFVHGNPTSSFLWRRVLPGRQHLFDQEVLLQDGPAEVDWCRRNAAGLDIVNVGPGTHFLPEDQPGAIGRALTDWLAQR